MKLSPHLFHQNRVHTLYEVPETAQPYAVSRFFTQKKPVFQTPFLVIVKEGQAVAPFAAALSCFCPSARIERFPGWECLPYDRVSPEPHVTAQRFSLLSTLTSQSYRSEEGAPFIIVTSIPAVLQRLPPRAWIRYRFWRGITGQDYPRTPLLSWLASNGFVRVDTVYDVGEYAVRGDVLDIYPPGFSSPRRLDFFGNTLESVRSFDPETQRSCASFSDIRLLPMNEVILDPETIALFRQRYLQLFSQAVRDDPLYTTISEGRRYYGMEHWLPLFHEQLETFFDYLPPQTPFFLTEAAYSAVRAHHNRVQKSYHMRLDMLPEALEKKTSIYCPIAPETLYVTPQEWEAHQKERPIIHLHGGSAPDASPQSVSFGGKAGYVFNAERRDHEGTLFAKVIAYIKQQQSAKKRVIIACCSPGSRERLRSVLLDHGLESCPCVDTFTSVRALPPYSVALIVLDIENGFIYDRLVVISEQDILGERLARRRKVKKKPDDFLKDYATLSQNDLIVHQDHGIGRFAGLKTIQAMGVGHECLELVYAGESRLYLPVENMEILSRYSGANPDVALDRLGSDAWQARRARAKAQIWEMALYLIDTAAQRKMQSAPVLAIPEGAYEEFSAGFAYDETPDQLEAINDVFEDMSSGRPMDRLICGDVGFGKTEVALRAAFLMAISGYQSIVLAPTTLLARQHFSTFSQRFSAFPIQVGHISRLVPLVEQGKTKQELAEGQIDIVIGTHALLGKNMHFKNPGLLIIDEEQRFGVKHKEKMKDLKKDIHVLTLTATPIPRSLQLALTGVSRLSLMTTPPVDRQAVHSFVIPFDMLTIREALLREHARGGQSFYVCPRIEDLDDAHAFLTAHLPELKVCVTHGRMPPSALNEAMNAFYDRRYDVLLSTTIIESGLDIPSANTLIVYRSDRFGLAQLYQLKGRVGRSRQKAYAFFTLPQDQEITELAQKRLTLLGQLDSLGAGFQLASHDLDLRGGGNLLGKQQSGHIREVGFDLYQSMLKHAVAQVKETSGKAARDLVQEDTFVPQISLGMSVSIPETYIPDLHLRMRLYRRASLLGDEEESEAFAAELIDRFGPLPEEVNALLKVVLIKNLCRLCFIEKLDAGPKGVTVTFYKNTFPYPERLATLINRMPKRFKFRQGQKLLFLWKKESTPTQYFPELRSFLKELALPGH